METKGGRLVSLLICIAGVLIFWLTFFGCSSGKKETVRNTDIKPVTNPVAYTFDRDKPTEASLWRKNGPLNELFINPKAQEIGDIVTIIIDEESSALNAADTNTSRDSTLKASLDGFLGLEKNYPASHPFLNPFSSIKGGLTSVFAGAGTTKRSGKLTARVTARVIEVLPNGNLRIMASREVAINNERQFISLSGIIRPRDISPNNEIQSSRISDAKIAYAGVGVVNDKQQPGWLGRVVDFVWPF